MEKVVGIQAFERLHTQVFTRVGVSANANALVLVL